MSVLFVLQFLVVAIPWFVGQSMVPVDVVEKLVVFLLLELVQRRQFVLQIVQMITFLVMLQVLHYPIGHYALNTPNHVYQL